MAGACVSRLILTPGSSHAAVRPQPFYLRLVGFSRLPQCHQLLAGGVGFNEFVIVGFSRTFVLSSDLDGWAVENPDREARLKPALALPFKLNHQLKLVALDESAKAD